MLAEVEKALGSVQVKDLIKPAHHYAYVEFSVDRIPFSVIERLRNAFTRHQIDVYPLYGSVPKRVLSLQPMPFEEVRKRNGLKPASEIVHDDHHFGAHNAHKCEYTLLCRETIVDTV